MKEMTSRLLALALTASLVLSGCGGTAPKDDDTAKAPDTKTEEKKEEKKEEAKEEKKGKPITDLVISRLSTQEISGFNILYTQKGEDFEGLQLDGRSVGSR